MGCCSTKPKPFVDQQCTDSVKEKEGKNWQDLSKEANTSCLLEVWDICEDKGVEVDPLEAEKHLLHDITITNEDEPNWPLIKPLIEPPPSNIAQRKIATLYACSNAKRLNEDVLEMYIQNVEGAQAIDDTVVEFAAELQARRLQSTYNHVSVKIEQSAAASIKQNSMKQLVFDKKPTLNKKKIPKGLSNARKDTANKKDKIGKTENKQDEKKSDNIIEKKIDKTEENKHEERKKEFHPNFDKTYETDKSTDKTMSSNSKDHLLSKDNSNSPRLFHLPTTTTGDKEKQAKPTNANEENGKNLIA